MKRSCWEYFIHFRSDEFHCFWSLCWCRVTLAQEGMIFQTSKSGLSLQCSVHLILLYQKCYWIFQVIALILGVIYLGQDLDQSGKWCGIVHISYMISIIVISIILEELRVKKLVLIADASAKALTPPPAVSRNSNFIKFFFTCINIYFLKQKRPGTKI